MIPVNRARPARGSMMYRNTCHSLAPSIRAASCCCGSMAAKPILAERTKNGAETKVWAITTAAVVKGMVIPSAFSHAPNIPALPNAINRAIPATEGGKTTGTSTSRSTNVLPGNFECTRMYARGVPVSNAKPTLMVLVTRLSLRALNALSESTYVKKSLPADRQTSAMRGKPIRPINTRLGRMNTQPGD